MGMILWGESPLYIIWEDVILTPLKVLAESKARKGDRPAEMECKPVSRRTETASKAEPRGESAQHDEAHPDLRGMVNAVSAGKDHVLTRGDLPG